jgi:8-oxo-dGTP pyrophosphatase MutT (NUDIX family)
MVLREARGRPAPGEPRLQCAALPFREADKVEVLLVTSRGKGRWVIPKGWPMLGRSRHDAAAIEALEEAGVVGEIGHTPLGEYDSTKRTGAGQSVPCRVVVYPLRVIEQKPRWREQGQRVVRWFPWEAAAAAVREPGLARIIRRFAETQKQAQAQPRAAAR